MYGKVDCYLIKCCEFFKKNFQRFPRNIFIISEGIRSCLDLQPAGSVSRVRLLAEILGKGISIECELVRHLAPITTSALLRALPVQDRVHRLVDKFVYMETGLVLGAEKSKTQFSRGDLAFLPSNGAVCFVIKTCKTQSMNLIGKVVNNIEALEGVQTGDVVAIKKSPIT